MALQQNKGSRAEAAADPLVVILMLIVGVYLGGWAAWYFLHETISKAYAYARYAELQVFYLIGELIEVPGISHIHAWIVKLCSPSGVFGACGADFSDVQWSQVSSSSMYINIFFFILILVFSVKNFFRLQKTHPYINFAKAHTMTSYVEEQKLARDGSGRLLYPHLGLFSSLDLISEPIDHELFGLSMTSKQFVFNNKLILGWMQEGEDDWIPTLDRQKMSAIFREQLGKHWTSSTNLSAAETLVVAIAIPRVAATSSDMDDEAFNRAMSDSEDMIYYCWGQFKQDSKKNYEWLKPDIDLTIARKIIRKYIGSQPVQDVLMKHAFNKTVIFALILQARRLGVLQPAEFRWLRFYDRSLWYLIQTIGRQAGYVEAAGILSHYLYETKAGMSLAEPQLDKAINGVEKAIDNYKFKKSVKESYSIE